MKRNSTTPRVHFIRLIALLSILAIFTQQSFAQCTCPGNLVTNPSFESGTTGWSFSGGNLNAGTGAVVCGSFSGDFQITNASSNWVSQTIGTDLPAGTVLNASVYAGTHNNAYWHEVAIEFFDANWNWIGNAWVEVNKVLSAAPAGPQLYTWTAIVPVGAKYTQASFSGDGDWIKTENWCVSKAAANTVALGNNVYIDRNGNGKKDVNDWGYDGLNVKLYADNDDNGVADGAAVASTTTFSDGQYYFANLTPGKYFVQLEGVPSWMYKCSNNGGDPDNNIDNDNNATSQNTTTAIIKGQTIALTVGGEPNGSNYNGTYDFGIFKSNGLGDFVFLDANGNGIQDGSDVGLAGVTVNLRSTSGALLETTTTDANGYYAFYDPSQYGTNNYNIQFVTPAGYAATVANQGGNDNKDSDPVGGVITNVNVPNGTWNYSLDAGFVKLGSISNFVWHDINKNGLQDAGEPGLLGKTVVLKNAGGNIVGTAITNTNGEYLFSNLMPGTYTLEFGIITNMLRAPHNMGGNNNINSKPNAATGIATVTIASGENNTTMDAGYQTITLLPVQDIVVMPKVNGNLVEVNWQTINEVNTSYFEVERSYNNTDFESVKTVYSLVQNGGDGYYRITDNGVQMSAANVIYRIKMVDKDGRVGYSRIANLKLGKVSNIVFGPNPFTDYFTINYPATANGKVSVAVFDVAGKKLLAKEFSVSRGTSSLTINNLGNLAKGTYVVQLIELDSNNKVNFQMVK